MNALIEFMTSVPLSEILIIYVAKTAEVTISTIRLILINKGYRTIATILSFIEILLWVFVASTVITGMEEKPLKGIVYALGFTTGIYLGSVVENKLAFGQVGLQVIVQKDEELELVKYLRDHDYAVTHFDAKGKNSEKAVLMLTVKRHSKDRVMNDILEFNPKAVVFGNEVSTVKGGYYQRRLFK